LKSHDFVIAAQENAAATLGKVDEEVDDAAGIGTAIHVVAEENEWIVLSGADESDQGFEGCAAAVNITDGECSHLGGASVEKTMTEKSRVENRIVFGAGVIRTEGMGEYVAVVRWERSGEAADFFKGKYSREHSWKFDGGATVAASPSPQVVRPPFSNPANVDPEEAFVASISSCHFLTFVWLASREGFLVESYEDRAIGKMAKNEKGAEWMSEVTLNVNVVYGGDKKPAHEDEGRLHHAAHAQCYIANSVKTRIVVAGFEH
jgi:organic hydroperoxide reductase OsmC/OhrA